MTFELRALLGALPPVEDPQYEFRVTELIEKHRDREGFHALYEDQDERIAFNALFAELGVLWRDRDFAQYRTRVREARSRFRENPRFLGLEAQACSSLTDASSLRTGLDCAQRALDVLPERPGLLHTFAQITASLADQGKADQPMLDKAEDALRQAISLEPSYAKYYATLARLLLRDGRYGDANEAVNQAIELEPSDGLHYALRIGDYQDIRMAISFAERSDELAKEYQKVAQELEAARADFRAQRTVAFQLLGLLAAIIAFIVTGVQVARQQKLADAAGLMIVIAASIVAVFAAFRLLFMETADRRAYVLLGAALLVIAGMWAGARWT